MKVLKTGKLIKNTMDIKCWKCKAKLQLEKSDLIIEDQESNNPKYKCICSECKREIKIKRLNENLKFTLGISK